MMAHRRLSVLCGLFAAVSMLALPDGAATHAQAGEQDGTPHGRNFTFHPDGRRDTVWSGPHCDNAKVIGRVQARFAETERTYWNSGLHILDIWSPREISHRHWEPALIASRSCQAHARLNDGRDVAVIYRIRSEQGFVGVSWGVDYCIVGDDPTYSYQPGCRGLVRR
ncbi:MAG: hypothetical protein AAGD23_12750 [Pseudomonadota bacterium]